MSRAALGSPAAPVGLRAPGVTNQLGNLDAFAAAVIGFIERHEPST